MAQVYNLSTALAQNTPLILERLMRFGLVGLFMIAVMSTLILPPFPEKTWSGKKIYNYALIVLQWFTFPITMIIFGSIPAVDAQTRLMLGKYMGFNVTEKK